MHFGDPIPPEETDEQPSSNWKQSKNCKQDIEGRNVGICHSVLFQRFHKPLLFYRNGRILYFIQPHTSHPSSKRRIPHINSQTGNRGRSSPIRLPFVSESENVSPLFLPYAGILQCLDLLLLHFRRRRFDIGNEQRTDPFCVKALLQAGVH